MFALINLIFFKKSFLIFGPAPLLFNKYVFASAPKAICIQTDCDDCIIVSMIIMIQKINR